MLKQKIAATIQEIYNLLWFGSSKRLLWGIFYCLLLLSISMNAGLIIFNIVLFSSVPFFVILRLFGLMLMPTIMMIERPVLTILSGIIIFLTMSTTIIDVVDFKARVESKQSCQCKLQN